MDVLQKIIINLLDGIGVFEKDKIEHLQFLSMTDVVENEDYDNLIIKLRGIKKANQVFEVLKEYTSDSSDSILVYSALTQKGHNFIILVEDLEELYSFHKILAVIKIDQP